MRTIQSNIKEKHFKILCIETIKQIINQVCLLCLKIKDSLKYIYIYVYIYIYIYTHKEWEPVKVTEMIQGKKNKISTSENFKNWRTQ